jgi:hypothetical protein
MDPDPHTDPEWAKMLDPIRIRIEINPDPQPSKFTSKKIIVIVTQQSIILEIL